MENQTQDFPAKKKKKDKKLNNFDQNLQKMYFGRFGGLNRIVQ
jgi:hypothetical protein